MAGGETRVHIFMNTYIGVKLSHIGTFTQARNMKMNDSEVLQTLQLSI